MSSRLCASIPLAAFLSRRFGFGWSDVEQRGLGPAVGPASDLFPLGIFAFANSASVLSSSRETAASHDLRDWFPDAGVLICREPKGRFAVAMKGGNNAENHNHNDIGSFVVAVGSRTPLVDPGSEVYTAHTFSSRRYDSNVINSFGHSVPMVGDQLQQTGSKARGEVVRTEFTTAADTLTIDTHSAYDIKSLEKLERTFVFSRNGAGSLQVVDSVAFSEPTKFQTALITFSPYQRISATRLEIGEGDAAVRVDVDTHGSEWEWAEEVIDEDLPDGLKPTRLGILLKEPVSEAQITVTITPQPAK